MPSKLFKPQGKTGVEPETSNIQHLKRSETVPGPYAALPPYLGAKQHRETPRVL